ncbi:E3 ubiquitin-protein ligase CHFR isoform X9 [Macaca thibetana thibetana]|uniref:E3 ubiquitin-protein ligase CHFR isoform X9 n=1 Tax=Macaca thibetana thibetana TaxID=257877 RepID=UPI0021BC5CDC|nr:E3 ubiquitin-protein ligase CHFR isoform X9 [Macaca thibetana thibetana]
MERPEEGKQPPPPPPQQPWGRLLRLGAEEGEPHVLLRKREWTIGRRRGCDLSFPGNKLVSGDHCKIVVDEKSGQVTLEDTSTNGTVINKLKVVKKQTCPLQSGDVIYLVYRKNEPEHNVAYLYESLNEKQGMTQESFEANKENVFHGTKDASGAGVGAGPGADPRLPPLSPTAQVCFEEPQPSTSTSDLFPTALASSTEPPPAGREHSSSCESGDGGISPKGCGPSVASDKISSFASALPDRKPASFSSLEPQDQEDLEPVKKKMKGDGDLDLNLQLLVAQPRRNAQTVQEDVRAATGKPDKMEETLTCIICQDLLHDCVSPACTRSARLATRAGWSARPCAPPAAVLWSVSVKTTSSTTSWKRTSPSTQTRVAVKKMCKVWMPGIKSLKTCCSPKLGGLFLMRKGVQRTCWSCQTLTVSPRTLASHTLCAGSVLSTEGRWRSLPTAQHPRLSQEPRRPWGMYPPRPSASRQQSRITCALCKEATPCAPAASSPCPTGERSASRTHVSPLSSVPSACSLSAICTGAAPAAAASAAWPRSVNL